VWSFVRIPDSGKWKLSGDAEAVAFEDTKSGQDHAGLRRSFFDKS
jgi:hypothetical protein